MNILKPITILLFFSLISSPLHADRLLDTKKAQKKEVWNSMMGFRNTLIFYTFKDQKAILALSIDNKDETFPVTGKIYLFKESTDEKSLKKWINNQHSDGLYPDIPSPVSTIELPKDTAKVTFHKKTGTIQELGPIGGEVNEYDVKFTVKTFEKEKQFKLSTFEDFSKVYVKKK